jgi:hypothetical protein
MSLTCQHPGCTASPHPSPAWGDTNLCGLHYRGLQADIADIARAITLDADWHQTLLTSTSQQHGTRTIPDSRPPIRVAALIDGAILEFILSWAADVIHTSRRLTLPEAGRILTLNAHTLAGHDAIADIVGELTAAAQHCRGITPDDRWNSEDDDKKTRPLGKCKQPDPRGEHDTCGGPLRWRTPAWTSTDDLAAIEVECARCHDVWGVDDLPHFLRVHQPHRRFPVPRDWVCRRYGVNDSTLRSWVRRGNVRTYDDGQVDLIDVLARLTDTPHTEQCLTTSQRRCNAGG